MAQVSLQDFATVGIAPTFTAAGAAGDTFANNGRTYLFVKNSSGASINVTINSVTPCSQGFDHDKVVAVGAGATVQVGPFPTNQYNDTSGNVGVTYSASASVTVAAVRV